MSNIVIGIISLLHVYFIAIIVCIVATKLVSKITSTAK